MSIVLKSRKGIIDGFLIHPHHFLQSRSPIRAKAEYWCGWFGQKHMCMHGYRMLVYYSKVDISS